MVLSKNEKKVLTYLLRNYTNQLSINELAKQTSITPKGCYKILKKYEKEGIVKSKKIANASIYSLNFSNQKTEDIIKYCLKSAQSPNSYVKVLEKDLNIIKEVSKAAILFGSVLTKGLKSKDIDLLVILDKKKFTGLKAKVKEFEQISPKKIHLVIQTKQDMKKNLHKQNPVILEILQKGYILWGYDLLYKLVENES